MFTVCTPVFAAASQSRSVENPNVPLSAVFDEDWDGMGISTGSGIRISRRRALGYSAVWRATNLISNSLAKLPLRVYRSQGQGKTPDPSHPAYQLLRRKPNDYMTAVDFKRTLQHHAILRGNGYAYIRRNADARPLELLPLNPDRVTPVRANGILWYVVQLAVGTMSKVRAADILHIRGLGFDGLVGYDVISYCRESLGKAIAARDYSARFFGNDARPNIALEFPAGMKDETCQSIVNKWQSMHQGIANKFRVGILREGIKLNQYQVNARDSQLLENLQFDANEIANIFGVPPHKVGGQKQGSYNSLFEENQAFFDDTVDPWAVTWEEQCDDKLLTEEEKRDDSHHCLFVRNALMRANPDVRSNYITRMVTTGLMNVDEGRAIEDLNPLPDGRGQVFYQPNNAVRAGEPTDPPPEPIDDEDPPESKDDEGRKQLRRAIRPAIRDAVRRMAVRLGHQVDRGQRDLEKNREVIREAFEPFVGAMGLARCEADAARLAGTVLSAARSLIESQTTGQAFVAELVRDVDSRFFHGDDR